MAHPTKYEPDDDGYYVADNPFITIERDKIRALHVGRRGDPTGTCIFVDANNNVLRECNHPTPKNSTKLGHVRNEDREHFIRVAETTRFPNIPAKTTLAPSIQGVSTPALEAFKNWSEAVLASAQHGQLRQKLEGPQERHETA